MQEEEIRKLPKVELHCHLDGSLSRAFIQERLGRPVTDKELQVSQNCRSLSEYLEKFDLPVKCLQDPEGLRGAGYDFLITVSRENVVYAEVRFAPLLSVNEKMDTKTVIASLLEGLEEGRRVFGVEYHVITCAMRHHSQQENLEMLKTAEKFLGKGVCAADLAGSEADYPMTQFMDLFAKVKEMGIPFTIHAGECGSVQNISDAVQAGAARIGHGIAMRGFRQVQELCREKRIGIEMCPLSNLQTKAVRHSREYPLREFLDAGLSVTINTDNRTVSGTSLTRELMFIQDTWGITDDEILQIIRNAAEASFADPSVKRRML